MGAGKKLWGYHPATDTWIPLQVDENGLVKVDLSNVNLNDLADVSVAAPTDGDFFYYDDATGLWKSKAHTALKTGVHGVGSDYIAKSSVDDLDLASHGPRHEYSGGDETDITYLIFRYLRNWFHLDWTNAGWWTDYTSGSGAFTIRTYQCRLETGIILNSEACKYQPDTYYFNFADVNRRWRFDVKINYVAGSHASYNGWIGWVLDPEAPTKAESHLAFYIEDDKIYASCGLTPNSTQEDTGVTFAAIRDLRIVTTITEAKFYIGDVLKKTFTTNLPQGHFLKFTAYIKTTDTNESILAVGLPNIWTSPN